MCAHSLTLSSFSKLRTIGKEEETKQVFSFECAGEFKSECGSGGNKMLISVNGTIRPSPSPFGSAEQALSTNQLSPRITLPFSVRMEKSICLKFRDKDKRRGGQLFDSSLLLFYICVGN